MGVKLVCIILFSISFHTMVSEAQTVRFGLIADVQYCDCENQPRFNRYFAYTKDRLREAKDTFNQHQLDFVINLGDIIEKDWESFDAVLPIFDSINAPGYHVLGNHDFWVADSLKTHVAQRLGLTNNYYSFTYDNYAFIVLDANDISTNAHVEGSAEFKKAEKMLKELRSKNAPNGHVWNGAIGSVQKQWLSETLKDAKSKGNQVIIFSHIPLYPLNMNTLWNYEEILHLLDDFNDIVLAVFAGHYHSGNNYLVNGIHHYTFKGMLDTPDENTFAIVTLKSNTISITGFGRENSVVLE